MATKVQIYNLALTRLGEKRLTATADDVNAARALNAVYDQVLDELIVSGPQQGWKFARLRTSVDVNQTIITAFADYGTTVTGTVLATAATHGLVSGEIVSILNSTNYDDEYEIVVVSADTFYFTATYTAETPGTTTAVQWTSEQYAYRFAVPSACKRLISVQVGGVELTDWVREGPYVLTNMESDGVDMVYVRLITDTALFPPYFVKVLSLSLALEVSYNFVQSATFVERLINEIERITLPRAVARDEKEKYVREFSNSWQEAGH